MQDVYCSCPVMENEHYRLRLVLRDDCAELLRVYSDPKAAPLFNSDNCHGDDFHYTSFERMKQAIDFWQFSYNNRYFVRWSVISKAENEAVGTIELFNRTADDFFNNCGLLRLDLRSDHENRQDITDILALILPHIGGMFGCESVATKAVPTASERICSLREHGFELSEYKLIGHDGTQYDDYYYKKI